MGCHATSIYLQFIKTPKCSIQISKSNSKNNNDHNNDKNNDNLRVYGTAYTIHDCHSKCFKSGKVGTSDKKRLRDFNISLVFSQQTLKSLDVKKTAVTLKILKKK